MKYERIINTISISKDLLSQHIKEGDIVLDATVGNGNDTLDLARLVGKDGKVFGFDIQKIAIENTKDLLEQNKLLESVVLINDSHENIDQYIFEPLDFAIYNLGYLPKGNKNIKTKSKSTVISVTKTLELLNKKGLLIIISYIGHPGGLEEKEALEEKLKELDQKKFNVLKSEFINQKNLPPLLYIIEKANK
ncbi:MAG: class I SAM-dependent methyltransferase [Tissierellaceae bacterium]|nr:class I SAM-dependent methyltransferase [Tissierellaceae bacterium]